MEYISTTDFKLHNTTVSLGKFDGLHIGHRVLIDYIISLKKDGYQSVVFTFDIHPYNLFSDREMNLIYTEEEKKYFLEKVGLDVLVSYPFTNKTASMEPEKFIKNILVGKLDAKRIVVGRDFRFGYKRRGDVALLEEMAKQYGYKLVVFDKVKIDHTIVSSSSIREELAKGNMEKTNRMLGQPYGIIGEVIYGNKIGRTLGMPTANILPDKMKLLPPKGVYASKTVIDKKEYLGVTNIGYKPTIGGEIQKGVETYVFDYDGDLYGKCIEVYLYNFERGEIKFNSLEDLKIRMHQDMEYGKAYFKNEES
jgi:riboflavin kinase / FMN adenylyltransferase